MISGYSAFRKIIGWPKKVVLLIFEMMIHNAYIVMCCCQQSGLKMKGLWSSREELVLHFMED